MVLPLGFFFFICIFWKFHRSKFLFYISGVILFFSSLGFTSETLWVLAEYPYKRIEENDVANAKAIVILGGGIPERFISGVKLYKSNKSEKLIFSSGDKNFRNTKLAEGEIYKIDAIKLGIPKESIFITKSVKNTADEATILEEMFSLNSYKKEIILVTSAFHMKRAKRIFERKGFFVIPFPVDFHANGRLFFSYFKNPNMWIPNSHSLSATSITLREFIGRIVYKIF